MRPKGLAAGAVLGILAVLASGWMSQAGAPPAYGVCVACHGRDLVAGLGLGVPSAVGGGLVLTTLGLVGGAFLAARLHRERRRLPARHPVRSLVLGALTMCASLLALGCTTRLVLRAAYGDGLALWSLGGVTVAIAGVTGGMVWVARRQAARATVPGGDAPC